MKIEKDEKSIDIEFKLSRLFKKEVIFILLTLNNNVKLAAILFKQNLKLAIEREVCKLRLKNLL